MAEGHRAVGTKEITEEWYLEHSRAILVEKANWRSFVLILEMDPVESQKMPFFPHDRTEQKSC